MNTPDTPEFDDIEIVEPVTNELPEDLAKTLDDLKRKYEIDNNEDHQEQPVNVFRDNDVENDDPIVITPLSNNTNLSRDLYNNGSVTIPNGTIQYRKWRVKDKKNLEASRTLTDMKYALILNCIEQPDIHKIALDNEELNFVLHNIRRESVHKPLKHTFTCPDCGCTHIEEINLENIISTVGGNYSIDGNITVDNHNITFGNPIDQELYNEFMNIIDAGNFQLFIMDMVLHIRKFDDITVTDRNSLINVVNTIDELDSDIADELVSKWDDIRYKVLIDNEVKCPKCESSNKFNFEDLPGFYPSSWNDWNI